MASGTAYEGGGWGYGTVFKVESNGTEKTLYSFTDGNDGGFPYGSLIEKSGHLYGTTAAGGSSMNCTDGCGTVFKLKK